MFHLFSRFQKQGQYKLLDNMKHKKRNKTYLPTLKHKLKEGKPMDNIYSVSKWSTECFIQAQFSFASPE